MDRPRANVWWRGALRLLLVALLSAPVLAVGVARAADDSDDRSDELGQVNAKFLAGFYRGNGETVELTIINPNVRDDGARVDALVLVYDREALPLGCGLFTLKPNEITEPIDLDEMVKENTNDEHELDEFGSVLVVITDGDADFLGTANPNPKKKNKNVADAQRGGLAYITQSDGSTTLSQVRLWPFDLDSSEVSQIRSDFIDSSFCDGSEDADLNRTDPAKVQSNIDDNDNNSPKSKRSRSDGNDND